MIYITLAWMQGWQLGSSRTVFFCQAEDGIRDIGVTGVQTCALPICLSPELRLSLFVFVGYHDAPGQRLAALRNPYLEVHASGGSHGEVITRHIGYSCFFDVVSGNTKLLQFTWKCAQEHQRQRHPDLEIVHSILDRLIQSSLPGTGGVDIVVRSVNRHILAIESDQIFLPIASLDFNTQAIGTADGDCAELTKFDLLPGFLNHVITIANGHAETAGMG